MVRKKKPSRDQPREAPRGKAGRNAISKRSLELKGRVLRVLGATKRKKRSPAEGLAPPPVTPTAEKRSKSVRSSSASRGKRDADGLIERQLEPAGPPTSLNVVPPPQSHADCPHVERGPDSPAGYGTDRAVAMVRDPLCIFVYWELEGGVCERIRGGYPDADHGEWVLRLKEVAGSRCEPRFFDVPVDPTAGNWYLCVEPETDYRVQLGIVLPSRRFAEAAASEMVSTPANAPSREADVDWAVCSNEFDDLLLSTFSVLRGLPGGASEERLRDEGIRHRVRLSSGAHMNVR